MLQMDFFYRKRPWYAGQFVRRITPKFEIPKKAILFFTTLLNIQKPKLLSVLVRDVDKTFKEATILLPIQNDKIDFNRIESFISELELEYVAELEAKRIAELSAYLRACRFENYELSAEEFEAIQRFENLEDKEWGNYRMKDLFERISTNKLPYMAKDLPKQATGKYVLPCLTSSFQNQGLNYYAPREGATVLRHVISLPSNSDVYRAYYQSREFTVLSDAYAIRWKSDETALTPNQYLFMVMCINKVTDLPIYSYKNKLGGWNVVKNKYIKLPQKDGSIDFAFMDAFISAMRKQAIQDVVRHMDKRIKAAKEIASE